MRKVSIIILLFSNLAFCQEIVTYDFQKLKFKNVPKFIKQNESVQIKIEKINLFLYDVESNGYQINYNKKTPELFKKIISTIETSVPKDGFSTLFSTRTGLLEDFLIATEKKNARKLNEVKMDDLEIGLKELEASIDKYQRNLMKMEDVQCLDCDFVNIPNMDRTLKTLKSNVNTISDIKNIKCALDSNWIIPRNEREKNLVKKLRYFATIENLDPIAMAKTEINMTNDNFFFISEPFIANADQLLLNIRIKPKKPDGLFPLRNDSISISIPIKRKGLQLTFSTGIFGSKNKNELYSYRPVLKENSKSEVDYYTIINETKNKQNIGLATLLHCLIKVSPKIALGAHFGLGVPIEKKFNIYGMIGPSIAFGTRDRILINFGYMGSFANKLSKSVVSNQQFKDTKTEIPLLKVFTGTFGASLTFNIYEK